VERVTADSNIYVSALRFGGKPLTLLEMALGGQIELAISDAILNETVGVLRDKFHHPPEQLQENEAYITACTTRVASREVIDAVPSDGDDSRVLQCAVAAGSDAVVTGDKHLLRLGSFRGIQIMTVSDFLQRTPEESR
jgi:uncharacterized protein